MHYSRKEIADYNSLWHFICLDKLFWRQKQSSPPLLWQTAFMTLSRLFGSEGGSRNFTRFSNVKLSLTDTSLNWILPLVAAKLRPLNFYEVPSICIAKIRTLTNAENGYQVSAAHRTFLTLLFIGKQCGRVV